MKDNYLDPCLVPTDKLSARLSELSKAIVDRDVNELTMCIPARPDRDADIVLAEAARRLLEFDEIISRSDGTYKPCPSEDLDQEAT